MTPQALSKLLVYLSRVTALLGVVIIGLTVASFGRLTDVLTIKPFFILNGVLLVKYAIDIHRKITLAVVDRYYSAIAVPIAIIPIIWFLGPDKSTTIAKATLAGAYFLAVGLTYKILLVKSGRILFGCRTVE